MNNFNLKLVFILISMLLISNFYESEAKDSHDDLKIDMNGSYKNDTIRISMTISNYGEQNYYFQLTYWLMSGFGAAPNNVSLRNEPLFYNEIIFHPDDNDGLFDGAYSFPTFNKLPKLVSLKQDEVFKINFQFVNKDKKIHIKHDSLEYQIKISNINETDYQNLTNLSKTDFTYTESSMIDNLLIDLKFGKYIYQLPEKNIKISKCDSKLLYALFSKYLTAKGKMKIQNSN